MFLQYWHVPPRYLEAGAPFSVTVEGGELGVVNAYAGAEVFCVVRDPFDRAMSEFRVSNEHALSSL